MIIYQQTKAGYLEDVDNNVINQRLVEGFQAKLGSVPGDRRVWSYEYSQFGRVLEKANVDNQIQVALEYHISAAGRFRIDVLLGGSDGTTDNGLIIELKAWERAEASDIEDMVVSDMRARPLTQHPCIQARKYRGMILNFNEDVTSQKIGLHSAAYLFNLHRRNPEPLEDARYRDALAGARLFLANDVANLREYLERIVPYKPKNDVLWTIENGKIRPTKELLACVQSMLRGNKEFELIDEQNEAFQIIRHKILSTKKQTRRQVFVVEGGPGTGKSVVAIQLLAEILKEKMMAFFVAPNAAFRDTLVAQLSGKDRRNKDTGHNIIRSSWSFHQDDFKKDRRYEVFIVDEAHRLKNQAYQYKGESMIEDMVRGAKTSVFFIDETQRVSWVDSGSIEAIRAAAQKFDAEFHPPMKLSAQFRCNGSSGYLNWLDDVLQIKPTGNFENWGDGQYEFKIYDRAEELYEALKQKNVDNKARLIAGYSWAWTKKEGRQRGTRVKHVQADGLSLPWNYEYENWATAKDGIEQVGCIHTSQGLEFDWLGVLIGPDLAVRNGKVIGIPEKRAKTDASLKGWKKTLRGAGKDPVALQAIVGKVQEIIKSTYKVLLTRGRCGCYVWCADSELSEYLKTRLKLAMSQPAPGVTEPSRAGSKIVIYDVDHPIVKKESYRSLLPLYSLKAAAGKFRPGKTAEEHPAGWIEVGVGRKLDPAMFVCQIVGDSMEPRIPNGSYCIFRGPIQKSVNGRIVLAVNSNEDPDLESSYVVKIYQRSKSTNPETGMGEVGEIRLKSVNKAYADIVFHGSLDNPVAPIIAEFISIVEAREGEL